MKKEMLILLFVAIFLSACTTTPNTVPVVDKTPDVVVEQPEEQPIIPQIIPTREERLKTAAEESGYVGQPLSGDETFYMQFNMVDYNFAIATDKLIFLNFYSTECEYCQEDNDAAMAAFDSIEYKDVIGFRVLFNEVGLTLDEKDIALKYGVENLNTKVIVKGGKRVFKATDTWDKQTFIDEINRNR